MYDDLMRIVNALSYAVNIANDIMYYSGRFMYLIMPSGWVFPIINEGQWTIPILEPKKFWAMKVNYKNQLGVNLSFNIPLPKQSIKSMWQAFIAPIDYYIEGSEYWPYLDENGDVKQGLSFTPVKKFGVYEHIPYIVKDILLIWFIIFAMEKLGLFGIAKVFAERLTAYYKDRKLRQYIDSSNDALTSDLDEVRQQLGELSVTTTAGFKSINSKIGVTLRLR